MEPSLQSYPHDATVSQPRTSSVGLAEALQLTLLLADEDLELYDRAAVRWHDRFLQEAKNVDLRESLAVLVLLAAIPSNRLAATALAELPSRRRSCERAKAAKHPADSS